MASKLRRRRHRHSEFDGKGLMAIRLAFAHKFGRFPRGDDPVFFDPDADLPYSLPSGGTQRLLLEAMLENGTAPHIVYAFCRTGLAVPTRIGPPCRQIGFPGGTPQSTNIWPLGPRQNLFSIEVPFTVTFPAHLPRVSRRVENIPRCRIEAITTPMKWRGPPEWSEFATGQDHWNADLKQSKTRFPNIAPAEPVKMGFTPYRADRGQNWWLG